jgi:hypothetical protein
LQVVAVSQLDRIARIPKILKVDSLDHAAVGNVKARDNSNCWH